MTVSASPSSCKTAGVFLTGSGSGIGHATARLLLERGYRVFGGVISDAEADALRAELGAAFSPIVLDVRDEASVASAAARVSEALGDAPLRAVLNIAGIIANGPLADLGSAQFQQLLAVNLVGVHTVSRAFLPLLARYRGARIINMSSASGTRTMPFTAAYSASKFGLEALSSAMRLEFAPLGIRVVVVAPGLVDTPMAAAIRQNLHRPPSLEIYREPMARFLHGTDRASQRAIPVARVARTLAAAVDHPAPAYRYEIHNSVLRDVVLMRMLPDRLRDALVRRMLRLAPGSPRPRIPAGRQGTPQRQRTDRPSRESA